GAGRREHAVGDLEPRRGEQPARDQRLGERRVERDLAGEPEDLEAVAERRAGAAGGLGEPRAPQPGVVDRPPRRGGAAVAPGLRIGDRAQHPPRGLEEDRITAAHPARILSNAPADVSIAAPRDHFTGVASGLPFSTRAVDSTAAEPLPMFFAACTVPAGRKNVSPALSFCAGLPSTWSSSSPSRM